MMRKTCLVIVVLLVCPTALVSVVSSDDVPAALRADILELMQLTGAANLGVQLGTAVTQQLYASLRQIRPDISPQALEITREVVDVFLRQGAEGELMAATLPIYAKYFTSEDIRGLITFYRTPLGQKAIAVLPAIVTESMQAGQIWAQRILPALQAELKKRLTEEGLLQQ